ncbi:MAG: proton-conducting transporter membrane subunit, partial [Candidatus Diapherotrites archaeon]|nr:proton-conducting transporter membrane subunit [Candidatus Diapherotrites archaeon]
GGLFHVMNHAIYKGLLFLTAGAVIYRVGTKNLNSMGGLAHKMPWTTVFFIVGALAIAGIPPFNGFASKLIIYESVFLFSPVLSVIAMLVSVLTLASFVKVFYAVFMGPRPEGHEKIREVPLAMLIPMGVLALLAIIFGLLPDVVLNTIISPAAQALINHAAYAGAVM